jgi:Asp-tRNA(Asn)/Glu-tRNA(Gln) amidotransferase A subunit family amidase
VRAGRPLGLVEAARRIASGELASADLTRSCLARTSAREPEVEAFAWLDPARAMRCAEAADAARRSALPLGPLHGLPIGVKDIFPTSGVPTERGSPIFRGTVPETSAHVVERMEEAGAFVLGKTVTAELAFFSPGKTRNPWNPAHTPGGSSSGSAAGVAAGFFPGALGTQTNGSVIRPAAFCGVVGYKPTQDTIPFDGTHHFSPSLDQVGVFGRSVADCAWLASAVSEGVPAIPQEPAPPPRAPRFAVVRTPVWERATPCQRERLAADVAALRAGGATIRELELPPPFDRAHAIHRCLMFREAADELAPLLRTDATRLSAALLTALAEGARVSDAELGEARAARKDLVASLDTFLEGFDAILTPPATGEAPAGLGSTGDPSFCTLWTLARTPALVIPTGLGPGGLPLGLQIVGRRGDDAVVLSVGAWCEQRLPFAGLDR